MKELFDLPKCSSDTERLPDKSLVKIPLPWRSAEFSLLAQRLDHIHIHKKTNTNGSKNVTNYTIESIRSASTSAPALKFSHVPRNLPLNCYAPEFLKTLSDTQKQLLNPKACLDLANVLHITSTIGESPTTFIPRLICSLTILRTRIPHSHSMAHLGWKTNILPSTAVSNAPLDNASCQLTKCSPSQLSLPPLNLMDVHFKCPIYIVPDHIYLVDLSQSVKSVNCLCLYCWIPIGLLWNANISSPILFMPKIYDLTMIYTFSAHLRLMPTPAAAIEAKRIFLFGFPRNSARQRSRWATFICPLSSRAVMLLSSSASLILRSAMSVLVSTPVDTSTVNPSCLLFKVQNKVGKYYCLGCAQVGLQW